MVIEGLYLIYNLLDIVQCYVYITKIYMNIHDMYLSMYIYGVCQIQYRTACRAFLKTISFHGL